uniref:Uncharacterized protein n=1 Tax=Amphimedon queenslandica TaxID=400682 RepID=A0A1X7TPM5_AMPQE
MQDAVIAVTVDGTLKIFQSILIDLIADFLLALVVHRDSWQVMMIYCVATCASCSDGPVPDLCWTGQGHHSLVFWDLCILMGFMDIYRKVQ